MTTPEEQRKLDPAGEWYPKNRNRERRDMYAFKRDLERVIRQHQIDKVSGIPAQYLASYFIRQYTAIETLIDNLETQNGL